jgi:uncharacterized protein with HEPN domain
VTRTDLELVTDALDHLDHLHRHLAGQDIRQETVADAVAMRLSAAIEALAKLPKATLTETFGDDWDLMWATRNRIAHSYVFIDYDIIRATVCEDLPGVETKLKDLQARLQPPTDK